MNTALALCAEGAAGAAGAWRWALDVFEKLSALGSGGYGWTTFFFWGGVLFHFFLCFTCFFECFLLVFWVFFFVFFTFVFVFVAFLSSFA